MRRAKWSCAEQAIVWMTFGRDGCTASCLLPPCPGRAKAFANTLCVLSARPTPKAAIDSQCQVQTIMERVRCFVRSSISYLPEFRPGWRIRLATHRMSTDPVSCVYWQYSIVCGPLHLKLQTSATYSVHPHAAVAGSASPFAGAGMATGPPGEFGCRAVRISTPSSVTRRVCSTARLAVASSSPSR
jgi:hypothetical protein